MPRSLLLSDGCEYYDDKSDVCGKKPYSLSVEHGEMVLCRKHYDRWLQNKRVNQAENALAGLTAEEKKALVKSLGA
ncbi:MAG: hypothetical protein ACREBU_13175 [Nitrososphaera sp.]